MELRRSQAMTTRTTSKIVTFARPFTLKGVDRILPPGEYRVVTDEELIEELSFPVYRRMATMLFVPADSHPPIQQPYASAISNARWTSAVLAQSVTKAPRQAKVNEARNHGGSLWRCAFRILSVLSSAL